MNITNNPYYTCVTSKENPYLDTVTFKPTTDAKVRGIQTAFLFDRMTCVTNAVPYILADMTLKPVNGRMQPTAFYNDIMKLVEDNPTTYNCTKRQLQTAYNLSFEVINIINNEYFNTKTVDEDFFKYGFTVLNNKFLENIYNLSINRRLFIDAMLKMSQSLKRFKK